jgi:hypothetical protein
VCRQRGPGGPSLWAFESTLEIRILFCPPQPFGQEGGRRIWTKSQVAQLMRGRFGTRLPDLNSFLYTHLLSTTCTARLCCRHCHRDRSMCHPANKSRPWEVFTLSHRCLLSPSLCLKYAGSANGPYFSHGACLAQFSGQSIAPQVLVGLGDHSFLEAPSSLLI